MDNSSLRLDQLERRVNMLAAKLATRDRATGGGGGAGAVSSVFGRTGAVTAASNDYTEAQLSFSDITTNNASTSQHGFLKKLDNTATNYMDGTGAWSVPVDNSIWTKIADSELAATNTVMNFASIATGYKTLLFTGMVIAGGANEIKMNFNNDTGTNYQFQGFQSESTTVTGGTATTSYGRVIANGDTDNNMLYLIISNTTSAKVKSWYVCGGNTDRLTVTTGYWNNTANEINRVEFSGTTFQIGSRIQVYGMK